MPRGKENITLRLFIPMHRFPLPKMIFSWYGWRVSTDKGYQKQEFITAQLLFRQKKYRKTVTLNYSIEILDLIMPEPENYRFDVEYWSHPYNVLHTIMMLNHFSG